MFWYRLVVFLTGELGAEVEGKVFIVGETAETVGMSNGTLVVDDDDDVDDDVNDDVDVAEVTSVDCSVVPNDVSAINAANVVDATSIDCSVASNVVAAVNAVDVVVTVVVRDVVDVVVFGVVTFVGVVTVVGDEIVVAAVVEEVVTVDIFTGVFTSRVSFEFSV
jgi:hypothetical protein